MLSIMKKCLAQALTVAQWGTLIVVKLIQDH
jgi:hypothetical protein